MRREAQREASPKGTAILIGGAEQKTGECVVLREIARRAGASRLALCTAGSVIAKELLGVYSDAFGELGVKRVDHIPVRNREDADAPALAAAVSKASVFFFTGGDQLRITSLIGGTRLWTAILDLFKRGGTVAGTSAGASALGETMPMSAEADEHKMAAAAHLLPALGLLGNVIVDQHFAQRGRMGRLIAGVAENPRVLGLGIDEDTALIWTRGSFRVIGSGAVYVVDGRNVSRSNLGRGPSHHAISVFDVRLHVLSHGDCFESNARRPVPGGGSLRRD